MGSRFRLALFLSPAFLITGIVGCLLHECGHIAVAKAFGADDVRLHYASMNYSGTDAEKALSACCDQHAVACMDAIGESHPCASDYSRYRMVRRLVTGGGPASNMLIGTVGFLAIALQRRKFRSARALSVRQWALVLLAFFWSRQIFNFLSGLLSFSRKGHWGGPGDESRLSRALDWPAPALDVVTAGIAAFLLAIVTFYFIPKNQRVTFLIAGITGSALCVCLWLFLLGPVVMP